MKAGMSTVSCLLAVVVSVSLSGSEARAVPVIQEIMYDGIGVDNETVFTELYGEAGFDLTGWSLRGVNGATGLAYRSVDLTGASISPDGIFVVATAAALGDVLAARDFVGSVDWQNGPDAVQLVDASGNVVDAIGYGNAGAFNSGEGDPAADVAAGQSLSRDYLSGDTQNNLVDFYVTELPTPGSIPGGGSQPVPEPGTVLLTGLGLAAAGKWSRHRRGR